MQARQGEGPPRCSTDCCKLPGSGAQTHLPSSRVAIFAVSVFPAPLSPEIMKPWFLRSRTWPCVSLRGHVLSVGNSTVSGIKPALSHVKPETIMPAASPLCWKAGNHNKKSSTPAPACRWHQGPVGCICDCVGMRWQCSDVLPTVSWDRRNRILAQRSESCAKQGVPNGTVTFAKST